MASGYDNVLDKYNWAQEHIKKFNAAVDKFRLSNPHTIGIKENAEAGYATYYVKSVPTIPVELPEMLGDAIHNLRSTLDYLAFALVNATGKPFDEKNIGFPIFDTPKGYVEGVGVKVPGLGKHCLKMLDGIQPYKGGFGHMLWQLHRLDIVDKHRLLLTIASVPVGRTMTPSEKANLSIRGPGSMAARQSVKAFTNPRTVPLHAGDELYTCPISEANKDMGFAFDIAINEPSIVEGLLPTFIFLAMVSNQIFRITVNFNGYL